MKLHEMPLSEIKRFLRWWCAWLVQGDMVVRYGQRGWLMTPHQHCTDIEVSHDQAR